MLDSLYLTSSHLLNIRIKQHTFKVPPSIGSGFKVILQPIFFLKKNRKRRMNMSDAAKSANKTWGNWAEAWARDALVTNFYFWVVQSKAWESLSMRISSVHYDLRYWKRHRLKGAVHLLHSAPLTHWFGCLFFSFGKITMSSSFGSHF